MFVDMDFDLDDVLKILSAPGSDQDLMLVDGKLLSTPIFFLFYFVFYASLLVVL